jgi:site-specific DNA recombinase
MQKVVGYIRVSTEMQARDGISLEMQRSKIEAYCSLHELTLSEIIADEGCSAKSMNRSGIQTLVSMVKAGEVEAIITYKLDRLSRKTKDILEMVELFDKHDTALHSITESLDTKSAIGRFVLRTLASLAEMERDLISERTKEAMHHLKASGKVYSRPTFNDTDTVATMRTMKAEGFSYAYIASELTSRGIPTARGGVWHASTVHTILRAL